MQEYRRQSDLFTPLDFQEPITLVGCGNIGSHTATTLVRMGVSQITLYDHDVIERHNCVSQAYKVRDVGRAKVGALREGLLEVNPEAGVRFFQKQFTGAEECRGVLIIAVDSLNARRAILEGLRGNPNPPRIIIDGRIGGEQLEVYPLMSLEEWGRTLEGEGDEDPCGARYICYTSAIIGGVIASMIKRIAKGQSLKKVIMHTGTFQVL